MTTAPKNAVMATVHAAAQANIDPAYHRVMASRSEMLEAYHERIGGLSCEAKRANGYRAMLDAAPQPS